MKMMKHLLTLAFALISICIVDISSALFQDQAGLTDWTHQNIGEINDVVFVGHRTIVGTDKGVIACLTSKHGSIEWRKILPKNEGSVDSLFPFKTTQILSLSDNGSVIRLWKSDGQLAWDSRLHVSIPTRDINPTGFIDLISFHQQEGSDESIVVLSLNTVHMVTGLTGTVSWSWSPASPDTVGAVSAFNPIVTGISLDVYGTYIFASVVSEVTKVNKDDGSKETVKATELYRLAPGNGKMDKLPLIVPSVETLLFAHYLVYIKKDESNGNNSNKQVLVVHNIIMDTEKTVDLEQQGEWSLVVPHLNRSKNAAQIKSKTPILTKEGSDKIEAGGSVVFTLVSKGSERKQTIFRLDLDGTDKAPVKVGSFQMQSSVGDAVIATDPSHSHFVTITPPSDTFCHSIALVSSSSATGKSFDYISLPSTKNDTSSTRSLLSAKELHPSKIFLQSVVDKESAINARILVSFDDESVRMLQLKKLSQKEEYDGVKWLWTREEALSNIAQVESVDMPRLHSQVEEEGANAMEGNEVVPSMIARWKHQIIHIKGVLGSFSNGFVNLYKFGQENVNLAINSLSQGKRPELAGAVAEPLSAAEKERFGFYKVLLLMSKNGKLFGMNSDTSNILWMHKFQSGSRIFISRSHEYGPTHPSEVVVIEPTGKAAWINVKNGEITHKQDTKSGKLEQAIVLTPHFDFKDSSHSSQYRNVIITMDESKQAHVYPNTKESNSIIDHKLNAMKGKSLHLWVGNENEIKGYRLMKAGDNQYKFIQLWGLLRSGNEKFISVASTSKNDVISAAAKALGDLSVLVKHINPNLIAVASLIQDTPNASSNSNEEDSDESDEASKGKSGIRISLVDSITGVVLKRLFHRYGKGPVHMVRFENMLVYSYWNSKNVRTEVSAVSIHDGAIDKWGLNPFKSVPSMQGQKQKQTVQQSPLSAFLSFLTSSRNESDIYSSYEIDPDSPIVLQKSFSMPFTIEAIGVTSTRLGISSKNVIMALSTGQVLSMDNRFLDPRRPQAKPTENDQMEGLIQYFPELPVIPMSIVSYYKDIPRVELIHTVPTQLESTSLLVAVGLDIFYARTSPSKSFDVLSEDFNYMLLIAIQVILLVFVVIARRFVLRKNIQTMFS